MIKQVIKNIKKVFIPQSEFENDVVCSIDNEIVDCKEFQDPEPPYIGIPAPVETPTDPWFTDVSPETIMTEKQMTHEEMLEEASRREEENRQKETIEPKDIHQKMYELSTKNWTTVAETQGGSENFQESSEGWNSGTGMRQFYK